MNCPICLLNSTNQFQIKTPCNHEICMKCFLKLKTTICPLCRYDFKNELPGSLKQHFNIKQELEKINLRTSLNLNDEYEFPPL